MVFVVMTLYMTQKKSKGKNEEIFFQYLETMTAYSKMSLEALENEYNSNMSWLFQCLLSK